MNPITDMWKSLTGETIIWSPETILPLKHTGNNSNKIQFTSYVLIIFGLLWRARNNLKHRKTVTTPAHFTAQIRLELETLITREYHKTSAMLITATKPHVKSTMYNKFKDTWWIDKYFVISNSLAIGVGVKR